MSNTVPLFVEVLLAIAVMYLFWITRKQAAELQILRGGKNVNQQNMAGTIDLAMVQDITVLLGEMQAAISGVRADFSRQRETFQEMMSEADAVTAGLRMQLTRGRVIQTSAIGASPSPQIEATIESGTSAPVLSVLIERFGQHLQAAGRSDGGIKETLRTLQTFTSWLGGHKCAELTINQVSGRELEVYFDRLWKQGYAPITVRRKLRILRKFLDWTKISEPAPREAEVANGCTHPLFDTYSIGLSEFDRHQTVFELAKRGLDHSAIATRTGLEREAVRLLLLTRDKGDSVDRGLFPLGVGLPYPRPDGVPAGRH